ncbi:Undecaprenyl phosphate-alpha-4-amino-4-deoxy-L-arabinose arabinosyl transferase [Phycisphaerales bacterium]|nr:Undecaprenyl phosphate-alpha-4-amino-4-deoxy-L-arabinose arabinosyl transferase [Phycisphaerales bacterium]
MTAGGLSLRRSAPARAKAAGWRGLLGLLALCLAVYLPGFFAMPPVDRDESRFAQASRQMVESGDYVVPRVRDVPRLNKPPMIYWLQSLAAQLCTFGDISADAIWMYRVPSLLGAIATVLLTWRMGCSMFDPRAAWLGAALYAICPVVAWEARQARADMVLSAFTIAAIWLLWEVIRRPTWGRVTALWIAIGFGVLVKGPVAPMILGLGLLAWCVIRRSGRDVFRTRPWLGVLIVAAIVGPWAVLLAQQVGWRPYLEIIQRETIGRSLEPAEGHSGFPGFHVLAALILMFPASLWVGGGIWRAVSLGIRGGGGGGFWNRMRAVRVGRPAECFLLCIALPAWIVFEAISTRLPHYTMPLYPAVALLAARAALTDTPRFRDRLRGVGIACGVRAWVVCGLVLAAAAAFLGWLAADQGLVWGWAVLAIAAAAALQFAIEGSAIITQRDYRLLLERAIRVGIVCLVLIGLTLPRVDRVWVVSRLALAAEVVDPRDSRPVAFVMLHEDSSVFLTRGRAAWIDERNLSEYVASNPDALVVLPAAMAEQVGNFRVLAAVRGVNYSKGEWGEWRLGEFTHE